MNTWSFNAQNNYLRWQTCHQGKKTLVYIHGLGCASSSGYAQVISSANYSCITSLLVDLPGAGFSDKPKSTSYDSDSQSEILRRWLTEVHFSEVSLFGHSAGAFIALKLARMLSPAPERLILCTPGLNEYGVSLLEDITAMSETNFIRRGFSALMLKLKAEGGNDAWLGAFQVSSPRAIWQWANSALNDNASDWMDNLAALAIRKGIILPDSATQDEISRYIDAGCHVELLSGSSHMMAYDNPDGLAKAITRVMQAM
ncbi:MULTISPECIES: alpha/beta fold hydrolase, partial [Dickeya]|uniref:alpha/beta fold hydrolase n=1 Tax=Dickeya TaxID=204037 RepID=UPI000577D8DE